MRTSPFKSSSYKHKKKISIVKHDTIGDFKIGVKIGQGTFSKVCQGIHIPTGEKVAIKILSKNQIKEKSDRIRIEKEISLQKKLHHQNIIQQYSVMDTEKSIYIITEYCSGGELFDYIVSKRRLQEIEACRIYQQLINGLEYLHKQKICHRDLKPENLLFDSKHNLKIADFGLSKDYVYGKLSTPCGSPCYAAPEMVTGRKYFGDTVDIWSSGIVLYSMVCGYLPFEDDNQTVLFHKIAKGLFTMPSYLSNSCKDLIKNILITDPKKRYGFEQIKKHPWFMSVNNIGGKNILFTSPGIIIDYDVIPIDIDIIKEIYYIKEYKNFTILNIVNDVIRNKHNKITTAYYLFLKKKLRNNKESISNINSNSKLFIEYIKNPISKMKYWKNNYDKIIEFYTNKVKEKINKEKQLINKIEQEKNKKDNKNNNLEFIYSDNDLSSFSDFSNEAQNNKNLLEANFMNDDIKLSTIVYDDEDKELFQKYNSNKKHKKKRYNSYQKEPEENYLKYKMNNYELDSDEPIIKDNYDTPTKKKQFYDMIKTNEEEIEENEINSLISENDELFKKIIKNEKINIKNGISKKKGRNKKNRVKRKKNNSACEVQSKNNNIKDLILSDKRKLNNKNILNTEDIKNKNNIANHKHIKNGNKKNIYNTIIIKDNKNKKEKKKKKKLKAKEINLRNNSYYYKKLASMLDKDNKILKFINKKNPNNIIQKENENINIILETKNSNNYNNINGIQNQNEKIQLIETKDDINNLNLCTANNNMTNGQKELISITKNNEEAFSLNQKYDNNKINNNLKVNDINNLYINCKYKSELINNNPNNRKEKHFGKFYKKLNDLNKYNKYIITNPNRNNISKINYNNFCINNNIKNKKYSNNSQSINHKNNSLINNKYIITENNYKIYKKSCPIKKSNNLDISNNNENSKVKVTPILLSETSTKHRKIINGSSLDLNNKLNPIYNQSNEPRTNSLDKNYLQYEKGKKRLKMKSVPKIQNGSNSVEIKDLNNNNLSNKDQIQNNYLEINNSYCSNGSNKNISITKEKTPKNKNNNIIEENNVGDNIICENKYKSDNIGKKTHNRISSYDNKSNFKYSNDKKLLFNNNNMIAYYKKFLNINKRYNNSVENNVNKKNKNFILEFVASNSNKNNQYNNSLITLNINKNKNKKNNHLKKYYKNFINNTNNINNNFHKSSVQNIRTMSIKKKYCFSQEKEKNSKSGKSQFNISIKSKITSNKNNNDNNHLNIHHIKSIKNENIKYDNNIKDKKIIDKINKIHSLICCNSSVEKIKNIILKVYMKKMNLINDKNFPMITVTNLYSNIIIKCKFINKLFNLSFELNISSFNDVENYILIKPRLLKGNRWNFVDIFQKIKNELLK